LRSAGLFPVRHQSLIHRGRETLKEKLKPYLRTGDWDDQQMNPNLKLNGGVRPGRTRTLDGAPMNAELAR